MFTVELVAVMNRLQFQLIQFQSIFSKPDTIWHHFPCALSQVDFQDAEARTVVERMREEERHRRMEAIYKEKVEAASKDMEGKY